MDHNGLGIALETSATVLKHLGLIDIVKVSIIRVTRLISLLTPISQFGFGEVNGLIFSWNYPDKHPRCFLHLYSALSGADYLYAL